MWLPGEVCLVFRLAAIASKQFDLGMRNFVWGHKRRYNFCIKTILCVINYEMLMIQTLRLYQTSLM
jgi:hypothetical protein